MVRDEFEIIEDYYEEKIKEDRRKLSQSKEYIDKVSKEIAKNIESNNLPVVKRLNVNKIQDLNDVKRILNFLNITVETDGIMEPNGYDEVRDLFE